ncbi:MAG: hypothetical protein LBT59_27625 [Clostridiales bacterium]|jgi:hypothetical protein|nr:hypothetical protein [Clostridiales bacterium]
MQIDFRTIVNAVKLPKGSALLPLFEAVVNSIQSIQEAGTANGLVKIQVIRDVPPIGNGSLEAGIHSFIIIDNGIGFNDRHFESFNVYGTDYKRLMGCKGVGRIFWLKAFSSVSVESAYREANGQVWERKFEFSISGETTGMQTRPAESKTETGAKVSLVGLSKEYKQYCPNRLETLAREIMNHCFVFLALDTCPQIILSDGDEIRSVYDVFTNDFSNCKKGLAIRSCNMNGHNLNLICAKSRASSGKHMLHFCANKREVFSACLTNFIPELAGTLDFTYNGYVTGALLDRFEYSAVSKDEIIASAIPAAREFLKNEIAAYAEKNKARIQEYVFYKNPRYITVLSRFNEYASIIPYSEDDAKLELELFKLEQTLKQKIKMEHADFMKLGSKSFELNEFSSESCKALIKELSDLAKGTMADSVAYRKALLETMARFLEFNNRSLEKLVHSLIFPISPTLITSASDCSHNLWIIDEKLAYLHYLASDKPLTEDSDIQIFESAFAFAVDFDKSLPSNIAIVSFKRPRRTDQECIGQVLNFIRLIREGMCKDKHGQPVSVTSVNIRFNCHIICDINEDMTEFLENRNFRTADGISYYSYFDTFNAFLEIIPYSKLLINAINRNNILFDQAFASKKN